MKTIIVIAFSNLKTDPRVNRQIRFLRDKYHIIAVGSGSLDLTNVEFIPIQKRKKTRIGKTISGIQLLNHRFESYYWRDEQVLSCFEKLRNIHSDLILANDIDTLPVALKLANGAKVIFDAHEYFPRQSEDRFIFRVFFRKYKTYLCHRYISKVDGMMTVCEGIANQYTKDTGVRPLVLTNAPDYEEIQPNLKDDHRDRIRLIHHGGASPSRKIENMIKMMRYLDDRFEFDLLLVPGFLKYIEKLKKLASENRRIRFLTPVPMHQLVKFSNKYDMGVYLLAPSNFNTQHALPNKFFEFIQARLALAIGPSQEMAKIVKKNDCGVVGKDFHPKSLASCLLKLDHKKINHYKCQSHKIARKMSAELNKDKLLNLVEKTLEK